LNIFLRDKELIVVLAGAESGVELADKLSERYCIDHSNGTALSSCRRNKYEMVQKLGQLHIDVPLTIKSNSSDEFLTWIKNNNLFTKGVVIKPLKSAGTDSVHACFNEQELIEVVNQNIGKINQLNFKNDDLIAQEYLIGTEYVVDSTSINGNHIITNICCYKKTNANNSKFVYDYLDFLPETGDVQHNLAEYVYKVLDGLGVKYGPAHSEIMLTDKGPQLIETGIRPHGGVAIPACRLATGNSHLDLTLDLILSKSKRLENRIGFKLIKHTRIVFLISHFESYILDEHQNLEYIKKLISFVTLKLNVRPGKYLKKTVDLFSMPGLLILSHESKEQVESDYNLVRKLEQKGLFVLAASQESKTTKI
ncbi:TPA: ATP-grasp domain-containing protein, partial [Legionella pneumophila]|nr:ATP-grasp domain-containing protein [Legionella pneumophila]